MANVKLQTGELTRIFKLFTAGRTDCFPGMKASDEEIEQWWAIYVGSHVRGCDKLIAKVRKNNEKTA